MGRSGRCDAASGGVGATAGTEQISTQLTLTTIITAITCSVAGRLAAAQHWTLIAAAAADAAHSASTDYTRHASTHSLTQC